MVKIICGILIAVILVCCTNKENKNTERKDNRISLRRDTVNIVKLSDTLVIYESTCRGCAYENSTSFEIADSMDLVKVQAIHTMDNNPDGVNGGNISKEIVLVPLKTGKTDFKLYKFYTGSGTASDSANVLVYSIEIIN